MQRDQRKPASYFEELLPQYLEGIDEVILSLESEERSLPDEQTLTANDLFDLRLLHCIASYSAGEPIQTLKTKVTRILDAKNIYFEKAKTLPDRQQVYRHQFEKLIGYSSSLEIDYFTRYTSALWWISLAVASGQTTEHCLNVVRAINQRGEDALLNKISTHLGNSNPTKNTDLLYPSPYALLNSVFDAPCAERPVLIKEFLDQWYEGCSKAAWHNNHNIDDEDNNWDFYFGYWCLEAVLVVKLLNIDDSSFRDHPHYPADLRLH